MTRDHTDADDRTASEQTRSDRSGPTLSRRSYVRALGAGVVASAAGSHAVGSAAAQDAGFDSFVDVDGTEFVDANGPVYFNGSNNFWLTDATDASQDRIDRIFAQFEELGIDIVRFWANGAGVDGNGFELLQPEPGVYNEDQLRLHDYVVATAAEHGIRLIPSLVDNWAWEGGIGQYGAWAVDEEFDHGNPDRGYHEVFYTNETAREYYRNHVETMATRENYYTGVEWREDPTIVMWELANEPRLETDWTRDGGQFDRQSGEHREILGDWIQEMSEYLSGLAPNQLVSTGSEGHFYRQGESYPDGTWGGQDFVEHHSYDAIDACSFHWYPDHWWCHDIGDHDGADCESIAEVPLERGSEWITEHVEIAHEELGKPAYLGEFNVRAERPNENQSDLPQGEGHSLETRHQHLQDWYETADEVDINAMVVWQVVLEDTMDHDGFQIRPSDDSADVVREYAEVVQEKSGGESGPCADVPTQQVEGQTVCDLNDDGYFRDVNGDGSVGQDDVVDFFEVQHRDAWKQDAFDFSGNGDVNQFDVVELFDYTLQ